MRSGIGSIIKARSQEHSQEVLRDLFNRMTTSSKDGSYQMIPTYHGQCPYETISMERGLLAKAYDARAKETATLRDTATDSKTEFSPADDLKEAIDKGPYISDVASTLSRLRIQVPNESLNVLLHESLDLGSEKPIAPQES